MRKSFTINELRAGAGPLVTRSVSMSYAMLDSVSGNSAPAMPRR
jgi:hypothetical protein